MRRPLAMVCLICIVAVWIGLSVFPKKEFPVKEVKELNGLEIKISGTVYKKEEQESYQQKVLLLYLKEVSVISAGTSVYIFPTKLKIICYVNNEHNNEEPCIGEKIVAEGEFQLFSDATNPGQFDSKKYYQSQDICGKLVSVCIKQREKRQYGLSERLYRLRKYWAYQIDKLYEAKEASVMKALLLGEKAGMDETIEGLYKRNGLIHAVSISGLHITCIGMGIYIMLKKLCFPTWLAVSFAGGIVILYGIMIGQPTSAYRAITMFLLKLLADLIGRTYDMLTALAIAALLIVIRQPLQLQNAGFLLSFGCVLGIILVYPVLINPGGQKENLGKDAKGIKRGIRQVIRKGREGICAGVSILLMTFPIQLYFYYEYPIVSVLWNLLVVPTIGIVLQAGIIQLFLCGWFEAGAGAISIINTLILHFYEWLCLMGDKFAWQKMILGCPSKGQIMGYYCLLAVGIWVLKNGKKKLKMQGEKIGMVVILAAMGILIIRPFSGIRLIFADVGQGDCILLQTKSDEASIFDCGSSSMRQCGKYILTPMIKYYGIRKINGIYVSHPDNDHMNGILEFMEISKDEKIIIKKLVLPYPVNEEVREEFKGLVAAALKNNIPVYYIGEGQQIEENAKILCLYPNKRAKIEGTNNASAVYLIQYKNFRALLTGDMETEGEQKVTEILNNRGIENINVLKVAHHGSDTSTGEKFLQTVRPRIALISADRNNPYGHPHKEVLERLEDCGTETLATYLTGAVNLRTDGKKVELEKYCEK